MLPAGLVGSMGVRSPQASALPMPSACCLGAQLPVCTATGVNRTLRRLYSAPLTLTYKALSDLGPLTRQASSQSWGCSHPGPGNRLLSQPCVYDNCYLFLEGSAPGPTQGGSFSPLRPQTQHLLHVQAFPDPLREMNGFLLSPSPLLHPVYFLPTSFLKITIIFLKVYHWRWSPQ